MDKKFIVCGEYSTDLMYAPAVLFRRKFFVRNFSKASIQVCVLGMGYVYINGRRITQDLFTAPVSDYRKTLWVNEYDVTEFLRVGENVVCVEAGNGFYNENFPSAWNYDKAAWRDEPKLCLSLSVDGETLLCADTEWKTALSKRIYYNQLRSGEYCDARIDEEYLSTDFEDGAWSFAQADSRPPEGEIRLCDCPPILEFDRLTPKRVLRNENGLVFDFGKNISGYCEIDVLAESGREITLAYAEEIDGNNRLKLNGLDVYYPSVPFQTDKLIANGKRAVWKPKFTYHGFRFVEVKGLKEGDRYALNAIFTHQALAPRSTFLCDNETLNWIYEAGVHATLCNTFYSLTDCPTREKLGWLNDAQASLGQYLLNFNDSKLLKKWYRDIQDAINEEGDLSGIAPSPDWGYGHGPVCNGILLSLPYMLYKYRGDKTLLTESLPDMEKYVAYLRAHRGESRLADWNGAYMMAASVDFVELVYEIIFCHVLSCGYRLKGKPERAELYKAEEKALRTLAQEKYAKDGEAFLYDQTVVSALLVLQIGEKEKLAKQLKKVVLESGKHINCGMFGAQFLFRALLETGNGELFVEMLDNKTAPSYRAWKDAGATALCESFLADAPTDSIWTISKNHHMYGCVTEYFLSHLAGLKVCDGVENAYEVKPNFVKNLQFVKGGLAFDNGKLSVFWTRKEKGIELTLSAEGDCTIRFEDVFLKNQTQTFFLFE